MLKSCLQLLLNLFVKKSETDIFGALDWDKTNYSTETVTGSLAKNLTLTSPCDGHLFVWIRPNGKHLCTVSHYSHNKTCRGVQFYQSSPHFMAGNTPVSKGQVIDLEIEYFDLTNSPSVSCLFVPLKKL